MSNIADDGNDRRTELSIYWLTKLYKVRASESASDPVTTGNTPTPMNVQHQFTYTKV
jgi:hypothetical protein